MTLMALLKCFVLNNIYSSFPFVQVTLPEAEVKAGLALQPQALEVSLVDRPLTDLLFTQFMASVSGKVYCLGKHRVKLL